MLSPIHFSISGAAIDPAVLRQTLSDPRAGAYASFEGWVRNHNEGQEVTKLEYEVFHALALSEGEKILAEAKEKFGVLAAHAVHREGALQLGDCAVWIGVISAHRAEAFAACRFIIDAIKHRVPIWKKEFYANGSAQWVRCQHQSHEQHGPAHEAAE